MPLPTLDTTIGGAAANSYVDAAAADAYFDARLETSAWSGAASDDKTRALLMAAERMQNQNWIGNRVTMTQRLAWPRWGARKLDPVSLGYGLGGYYTGWGWYYGDVYLTTEIPQPIKDAQCEWALSLLEGFTGSSDEAMESFAVDGVTIKFRDQSRPGSLPDRVSQLLAGLVTGNMLIRA